MPSEFADRSVSDVPIYVVIHNAEPTADPSRLSKVIAGRGWVGPAEGPDAPPGDEPATQVELRPSRGDLIALGAWLKALGYVE